MKVRALIQLFAFVVIMLSLLNIINPYYGFPIALFASLVLDFIYVFEYYKQGNVKMARRHIYYMMLFVAMLLFMLYM